MPLRSLAALGLLAVACVCGAAAAEEGARAGRGKAEVRRPQVAAKADTVRPREGEDRRQRITIEKTPAAKASAEKPRAEPAAATPASGATAPAAARAAAPETTGSVGRGADAGAGLRAVPGAPSEPVHARAASFEVEDGLTRFTLELSKPVAFDAFGLTDPYRLVIDLPETRFDFAPDPHREGKGLVTSWRHGLFMTGRSRLVFDLAGPVRIETASIEPQDGGGARAVFAFRAAARAEFEVNHVRRAKAAPVVEGTGILPKGDREATRPERAKPMVVIDPGHGGLDVGTRSPASGTFEKTVVLDIARLLEKKLLETGRYEVRMTRSDDRFIPLAERVAIARAHHADLFLSIHADAEYDRSVRGATVYTLDDRASDTAAAALAAKENASDALAGVVPEETMDAVADILIDLTVRETKRFSQVLARTLIDDLRAVGRLVKANPHRSANFRVLKAHDIPSALVELGFLSNRDDEQLMMSTDWREKTTAALIGSIDRFFQGRVAKASD
ncbi:N-acetylmuramoyl-L-alanine amidase [Prosthecomicrobium sp. N25]|uniref:N-acetylmuramoyl-L-alanine amidase n=1 Tax=Prosthecomicrobium sp. N25 TaxID=3129254 RepID=UPI003076C4E4